MVLSLTKFVKLDPLRTVGVDFRAVCVDVTKIVIFIIIMELIRVLLEKSS